MATGSMGEGTRANKSFSAVVLIIWTSLAAAYGGQKGNCIIIGQRRIPRCEFLVARSDEGGAERSECWESGGIAIEQIRKRGALGNLCLFLGDARELSQATKEEDFDPKMG